MKRHNSNSGDIGKRYRWFLTCFLASVALMILGMSDRAAAIGTIISVNSLADDGTGGCTLREAIENANNNNGANTDCDAGSGDDKIIFSVTGTITLGSTLLPPIADVDGLTIDGGSLGRVTISGNNSVRVFRVNSGVSLTLENLIVNDGQSNGGSGINNQGTLTVTNSTLSGNSTSQSGGGITNDGGTVTITNSTLSGNSAAGEGGGGIYSNGGTVTIINSTLSANSAAGDGGGIFNLGTLTITNSTLSGNSADSEGGGILNLDTLTVTNSTLSGNSADSIGGGISNHGSTVTITNSTLSGNSASSDAGGIFNIFGGTVEITNSTLSGNSAHVGGIFTNDGDLTITNSTLSGNSADNDGGAIFNRDSRAKAEITNSTLSGNSATEGGGIFNNPGATVAIKNSIFNNLPGGNCVNSGGTFAADTSDLATDSTCPGFATVTSGALNLASLADNGGPTQTHALLPGSPAIDAADDSVCPATDQRDFPRDIFCDIGAFEFIPGPPPPPPAQADVSIAKGAAKTVKTGKQLTYTIQVTNNGPNPASTVVVNDTLPLGTTFVSLTHPGATCTPLFVGSTGTLSCSYASLTSGSSVTLTLVVKVTAKGNGTNITNTATVTSATSDPNLANNSATATTKLGK